MNSNNLPFSCGITGHLTSLIAITIRTEPMQNEVLILFPKEYFCVIFSEFFHFSLSTTIKVKVNFKAKKLQIKEHSKPDIPEHLFYPKNIVQTSCIPSLRSEHSQGAVYHYKLKLFNPLTVVSAGMRVICYKKNLSRKM